MGVNFIQEITAALHLKQIFFITISLHCHAKLKLPDLHYFFKLRFSATHLYIGTVVLKLYIGLTCGKISALFIYIDYNVYRTKFFMQS